MDYLNYIRMLTRPKIHTDIQRYDDLLRNTAKRLPNRIALVYKGINFSFETLDSWVNAIARTLVEDYNVKKNDVVGLTTLLCPEAFILYLAIARAGGIVTPINPLHIDRDIEYQLKDSGASIALLSSSKFPIVDGFKEGISNLKKVLWFGEPSSQLDLEKNIFYCAKDKSTDKFEVAGITCDDIVALPYSSGTTGLPKGVMLTHGNLIANALQFTNSANISDLDIILNGIPILINLHIGAGIASGAKQILLDNWELKYMLSVAKKYEVTTIYTVVPIVNEMSKLENLEDYRIPSLKLINSGASNLATKVAQNVSQRLGVYVVQGFGSQETSTLTHVMPFPLYDGMSIPSGSCGILLSDTEHRIVDISHMENEVSVGEPGELLIKGPQIMKGYWNDEEKTRSAMLNGWFCTGDIVKKDEQGIIYFVDRKKDIIKSSGHSISPSEIESLLKEIEGIAECAVIGIPVGDDDEIPVGYIRTNVENINLDEILEYVNSKLASYKNLKDLNIIDTIPKVSGGRTGKINRKALREKYILEMEKKK